ncbi:MAG: heparinase II/III family protein [Planctomycetota bacterium]|nr:heparinase II/III family protein [Planctomycetota bacterium]
MTSAPSASESDIKLDLDLAERLCRQVDWKRPEFARGPLAKKFARGDWAGAATGLVRHLRKRRKPDTGYSLKFAAALRSGASPESLAQAGAALEAALAVDPLTTNRGSPAVAVDPHTLILAITGHRFERLTQRVIDSRPNWGQWGRCGWGTCCSINRCLRALFPLPECDDAHFVPLLAFLVEQATAEWSWSHGWDEALLGTSGHNYWAACYGGLAQAGLLFPEFLPLAKFGSLLPGWLDHELNILMAPDGFTRERSGYHWGTADELFDLAHLAAINGRKLSPRGQARLQAMAEVDWKVVTPDGDLPYVGDTGHRRPGCLLGRVRLHAALAESGESKWVAERLEPKGTAKSDSKTVAKTGKGSRATKIHIAKKSATLHHLGRDLMPVYRKLKAVAPKGPDTCLPDSGYYFIRRDWSPTSDYACIDAGTRGNIVTSHDHAAVFHLLLHSHGTAVLVDNCSGHYGDNPARTWRVGSASHNLATADEQDIVPFTNEWRWEGVVAPAVQEWVNAPKYAYFSGVHEGYARLKPAVPAVRRKLFYLRGGYWILIDRFTAASKEEAHTYDLNFHLAKPATLGEGGRVATAGPGGNLLILPVAGASGEAALGPNPHPLEGYENPAHLRYRQAVKGHGLFVTLLVPFEGDRPPRTAVKLVDVHADERNVSPWEATGLEITHEGRRDVYVDQHMEWVLPWKVGGVEGDARVFHSGVSGKRKL